MRKTIGLVVILGLAATPVLAQKVTVDYAHDFDFSQVKTFQYVDTEDTNIQDPLMAGRVVDAIKRELGEHGLGEVQKDGDLLVTYHYSSKDNQVFQTTSMGMGAAGMGPGWGRWGWGGASMGTSTTRATTYTQGTLVIDAYDPKEKQLVWRGSGSATVKGNPQAQIKQVDKVLKKLGKRWDKIVAGKGK